MSYEELEHTADVLVRVCGSTLPELFTDAAMALFSIMAPSAAPGRGKGAGIIRRFAIEADDLDSLLHDFLSELLYLADAEGVAFYSCAVEICGTRLACVAEGEPFDPAYHAGGREIKGISYSGMHIKEEPDMCTVEILFDV